MRWFKCPSLSSPAVLEAKRAIGLEGVMQCLIVIEEAMSLCVIHLDEISVSGWAQIRIDRARRILPYAQKILDVSQKDLGISSDKSKDLGISSDKSNYLPDNTPSNPVGTVPLIERIEKREEKELPPTPSECPPQGGGQADNFFEVPKPLAPIEKSRPHKLPKDFKPDDSDIAWLKKHYPGTSHSWIDEQAEIFCNHFWHNGKTGLDWHLAFKNWMRNSKTIYAPRGPTPTPPRDIQPRETRVSQEVFQQRMQQVVELQRRQKEHDNFA